MANQCLFSSNTFWHLSIKFFYRIDAKTFDSIGVIDIDEQNGTVELKIAIEHKRVYEKTRMKLMSKMAQSS